MVNLHTLRIKNGKIWNGRTFLSGDVLIKEGIIAAIGDTNNTEAEYEFDADGYIVTPGLIDIHTHMRRISNDGFGIPIEAVSFPNGVTAAADAAIDGDIKSDKALMESFMVKSVGFVSIPVKDNQADFSKTEDILTRFGDRAIGLKIYFDTAGGQVRNTQPVRQICEYAHKRGLKVMVHSTDSPVPMSELLDCLMSGDICTHAYHGGINNAQEDNFASLKHGQDRGVIIDCGLAGGVHADFAIIKSAMERGIFPDTISTDITKSSAFVRGGNYGLPLCMSIMRTLGMPEDKVLRAVTIDAARAINREDEWGLLKEGHCADVAVLRYGDCKYSYTDRWGHSLAFDKGYQCLLTIADGQVVYRHEAI